jgi:alkylation response protein AidB-like acyl-CoA dehydrogenase
VRLALTAEQAHLKAELRDYFASLVEEIDHDDGNEPTYTRCIRRMGHDGWLGLGWPPEYGGQGRDAIDQMIFVEESHWAGVPIPLLTLNSVGPTLMALGTDAQKRELLPKILRGELHFEAVRDGDEYVINGQKLFTSAIEHADYVWLAVRTDPDAPKHKGLSVILVPTSSSGFHYAPLHTMAGEFTSATFYEDVRVPVTNLVGDENQGWKLITNQLNHERVAICPASGLLRTLAKVLARAELLKLMNWKVAWAASKGLNPADASATKVFGTEFTLEAYRTLMEVVGATAYLEEGTPGAALAGRLERAYRANTIFTFGGGTNEIQRDLIAMIGLGMPRAPR